MTTEELTLLLARIQVLDNRQVDELTIEAWSDVIGNLEYRHAVQAVNDHFRYSTEYLRPAHIVDRVREIRASEQHRLRHIATKCLDARYEPDDAYTLQYLPGRTANILELGRMIETGGDVQAHLTEMEAAFARHMDRDIRRKQPPEVAA